MQLKFDDINETINLLSPSKNDLTLVQTGSAHVDSESRSIISNKKTSGIVPNKTPVNSRILPARNAQGISNSARPPLPTPKSSNTLVNKNNNLESLCKTSVITRSKMKRQQGIETVSKTSSTTTTTTEAGVSNSRPSSTNTNSTNSKLSSASNAANMVKLAAANLLANTPGLKRTSNVEDQQQQQAISTSVANKRTFEDFRNNKQHDEMVLNTMDQDQLINTHSNDELNTSQTNSVSSHHSNFNNDETQLPKNKRLALRQCLVSRYHEEFHEVCKLGSGEFGDVFKCINRLDGCTYAIKRSKKPIAGSALETAAWKEVCAHAVLVKHNKIVQYYSAWAEADRMLIQNEYCNGGSLAEFIESLKMNNVVINNQNQNQLIEFNENSSDNVIQQQKLLMTEFDLKTLLLHIAKGLSYMHAQNLVHLDIKPGNIFICRTPRRHNVASSSETSSKSDSANGLILNEESSGIESDDLEDDETGSIRSFNSKSASSNSNSIFSEIITYKIGDLGHVTSTLDPHVEEGDCRYLPNEILQEQYDNLTKADVFALALTVHVAGALEEVPKNGEEWHWIRRGNLKDLPQCGEKFKKLLIVS
jgi:wee1-like protein kinase